MSVRMPAQRIACQIALVLVLVLTVSSAANARRAALVIGNSAYEKAGALANPANDATAVADAFKRKGFEQVTLLLDLDQKSLLKALKAFSEAAAGADVAAIYYAGSLLFL